MRHVWGGIGYDVEIVELEDDEPVERDEYVIEPFPVATAAPLRLRDRRGRPPGRFDAALAEQLGVAPGPDFGRLQRGEVVERRPSRAGDRARTAPGASS